MTRRGAPRKRAGRPALGAAARSETVRVRVTPEMRERVRAAAGERSESDWGLEAFERHLADEK